MYPIVTSLFFAFCSTLFTLDEYQRVFPALRDAYLLLKSGFSLSGFAFAWWFYRRGAGDFSMGLFALVLNLYTITFMWFAPLYEMAYLQASIAAAFFRFRRSWIFPTVFGFGLAAILGSYSVQDRLQWTLPPETRSDWVLISLIMFLVSSLVHRFAISHTFREHERIGRLSALGHDAIRILHDVKGLSSTPLLLSQRLAGADDLKDLATSIENVQTFLRATQRLVNLQETKRKVQLGTLVSMVLEILRGRLRGVTVDNQVQTVEFECNPNRLFSVLYNVLLILAENFGESPGDAPQIVISTRNSLLIISDNNRQSVFAEGGARSLRERVIASDLRHMNCGGEFSREHDGNRFGLKMA